MSAILKITEATGKTWELALLLDTVYTIGRAKDNQIVLNDQRVSRYHAHISSDADGFSVIDGCYIGGQLKRSVNKVFVNGTQCFDKVLTNGEIIMVGGSKLVFEQTVEPKNTVTIPEAIRYEDQPLGHTQMLISAKEIIGKRSNTSLESNFATPEELKELRRKAQILDLLYEMTKMLGTVFDLKEIFSKATELIFRVTPAERVVALLADESIDGKILDYSLYPIAIKARDKQFEDMTGKLSVSRTITQKVMSEKVAILSQDARSDAQFSGSESIVAQGVRSTICAPLITEANVHGIVYADRLDPFKSFSEDDLELITTVAAQTAMVVETVKAHKRLAREEVARANYSRFMPEYVVKQLLDNPNSFRLGGINQKITVLFADIRAFTALSERENPEKIVSLLNHYFSEMTEIIFTFGGTLDKYIGDGLMAIFGAPTATSDDAKNALQAAVAMQKRLITLNQELEAEGFKKIGIGIGLHTGEATIGYIGSEKRSEYTAIGDTVNLASRLESNAKAGQILISEKTAKECKELYQLTLREPLAVKNRTQPVSLFEVKWN
ncbi:MAG: FHA domain-containing protein [Pyrinomonadaceae bacterium]|nr:FHA domain-containing protein [Pyrinomonadaceae bacterium]